MQRFAETDRLPVEVRPHVPAGALRAFVDDDQLELDGEDTGRPLPFGANVSAAVLLDMDDDRIVNSVEVLTPLSAWNVVDDLGTLPPGEPGAIAIVGDAQTLELPEAAPTVELCERTRVAHVLLEPMTEPVVTVRLSESCSAIIDGTFLIGFAVQLGIE